MKTAQELRAGNVFRIGSDPMVVQKTESSIPRVAVVPMKRPSKRKPAVPTMGIRQT